MIFGIAGFGTALVAGPVLAQFVPVATVVPLLALLDFVAAVVNVSRDAGAADRAELRRLVPLMAFGSLVGAALLLLGRPQSMLLALGIFAVAYALYALSGWRSVARLGARGRALRLRRRHLLGHVRQRRLHLRDLSRGPHRRKERVRVTQSTLIGLSTLTRALLFLAAGVYAEVSILALAVLLLPAMLLGTALGRRITLRLSREQFLRVVALAVLCSGAFLVVRYAMG